MKRTNVVRISYRESAELYRQLNDTLAFGKFETATDIERKQFLLKLRDKMGRMITNENND